MTIKDVYALMCLPPEEVKEIAPECYYEHCSDCGNRTDTWIQTEFSFCDEYGCGLSLCPACAEKLKKAIADLSNQKKGGMKMIKLENPDVYGWEAAIRGMRNPMNSWDNSDSYQCEEDCPHVMNDTEPAIECNDGKFGFCVGHNDLKLMKSLSKAGNDHSKFLRMINVTVDITAPLYWWKEFDTYKVGTVANSCSTMHKIHAKEFTLDDFSCEHLFEGFDPVADDWMDNLGLMRAIINVLNDCRYCFLETKDKRYWWQMIQLLPSSYNQKRTVQLNYQVLKAMYFARRNHKLDEWRIFCEWCEDLPYFKEICIDPMEESKPEIAEMVRNLKGETLYE